MKESKFQKEVIDEIKSKFPGAIILKNDPNYICGIPDLIVLWNDKWAALEVKRSKSAHHQPLQDYYINLMNKMSFARFISPENKEDVLNDLERSFKARRRTRISRSK